VDGPKTWFSVFPPTQTHFHGGGPSTCLCSNDPPCLPPPVKVSSSFSLRLTLISSRALRVLRHAPPNELPALLSSIYVSSVNFFFISLPGSRPLKNQNFYGQGHRVLVNSCPPVFPAECFSSAPAVAITLYCQDTPLFIACRPRSGRNSPREALSLQPILAPPVRPFCPDRGFLTSILSTSLVGFLT